MSHILCNHCLHQALQWYICDTDFKHEETAAKLAEVKAVSNMHCPDTLARSSPQQLMTIDRARVQQHYPCVICSYSGHYTSLRTIAML
jgi:hypothetical protein